ncbi:chromate efflux transporter [Arcobacter roscoffensis]|uniref:Chromate efflux transporter n=1 Tax=Arcobacter roscoffensis TaxID=2961520 RepID=A0ABY5E4T0_9BACT|nr:chromate efflux transporter [Arcobacter roscoffensis]UTJ06549.1 chromate efflux transporter [Arcobacter roscoffensis]
MKNYIDIFIKFFTLGLFSFGGPMAHIGYFRKTFVEKLNWLDDSSYSRILALSQFLPGPSSSQVGFAIGLKKGGLIGAITAFVAFTFPSFILLYFIATFDLSSSQNSSIEALIIGLKLFAVVIVSDAIISMFKSFCKDKLTISIFAISTILLISFSFVYMQILVLVFAGVVSYFFVKKENKKEENSTNIKSKKFPLFIFFALLFILPLIASSSIELKIFSSFYETGSLVFGGGHVVLPLLQDTLGSLVSKDDFILSYSLAQAVPGPMFTIASYLGATITEEQAFMGALIATLAIFLPGFLLILAFYDSFESLSKKQSIKKALIGINAGVVALLFAVLINTVFPNAVYSIFDFLVVLIGLFILRVYKTNIFFLILGFILFGFVKTFFNF